MWVAIGVALWTGSACRLTPPPAPASADWGIRDRDGDGVPDARDAFPSDPAASLDTDGDGHPDAWNPGKGPAGSTLGLSLDAFPSDRSAWLAGGLVGPWTGAVTSPGKPAGSLDQDVTFANTGDVVRFEEASAEGTVGALAGARSRVLRYDDPSRAFAVVVHVRRGDAPSPATIYRFEGRISWDLGSASGVVYEGCRDEMDATGAEARAFYWTRGGQRYRIEIGWADVARRTSADGSTCDTLEMGFPGVGNALRLVTAAVSGPGGFRYTFSEADRLGWTAGTTALRKAFPTLSPGVYTFSLADSGGQETRRSDLHAPGPPIHPADASVLQQIRLQNGAYRFRWAAVGEGGPHCYRLRIRDLSGTVVYDGQRRPDTSEDVAAGSLVDGESYEWTVETHDGPTSDRARTYSESASRRFTPAPEDLDSPGALFRRVAVFHDVDADGRGQTNFWFETQGAWPLTSAEVGGPGSFHYRFDLTADLDPLSGYLKRLDGTSPVGTYTFHLVSEGRDRYAHATLSAPAVYPSPDVARYRVDTTAKGRIRFQWARVDGPCRLYYRAVVESLETGRLRPTPWVDDDHVELDAVLLPAGSPKRWRVEVGDGPTMTTIQNRRAGPWIALVPGVRGSP